MVYQSNLTNHKTLILKTLQNNHDFLQINTYQNERINDSK